MEFPKHKCSMTLSHNDHLDYYTTVENELGQLYHAEDFVSDEQRRKAIETNECWTIQWYPRTPVGFYVLHAADLDVLMAAALEYEET